MVDNRWSNQILDLQQSQQLGGWVDLANRLGERLEGMRVEGGAMQAGTKQPWYVPDFIWRIIQALQGIQPQEQPKPPESPPSEPKKTQPPKKKSSTQLFQLPIGQRGGMGGLE